MKYYKLYVAGSRGAGLTNLDNLVGTILDKEGKPVYTLDEESLKNEEYTMKDVPKLAVDGTLVGLNTYVLDPNKQNSPQIDDFDITFTTKNGDDDAAVATVRLNKQAAERLIDQLQNRISEINNRSSS